MVLPDLIVPSRDSKRVRKFAERLVRVTALVSTLGMAIPAAQAQTLTVLYSFKGGSDGSTPFGSLVRDSAGDLYGTTKQGGTSSLGTVFRVESSGKETVLYSFAGGNDGASPTAGVVRDSAGNLYGATPSGGSANAGTVFKLDASGKETVLHSFGGGPGGSIPERGVIRDSAGNLYGATEFGGDHACGNGSGCGIVFKLNSQGKQTVLHTFSSTDAAADPVSTLVRDSSGNLFGTTLYGGVGEGTIFQLDSKNNETVLYIFSGGTDGGSPLDGLVADGSEFAGLTSSGGTKQLGVAFKVDRSGNLTVLHDFTGGSDGSTPSGVLFRDSTGNLYGTTLYGGTFNKGTVFKIDSSGRETLLHTFTGGTDGANPFGGVVRDAQGNLYGTTEHGGASGLGVVFKITP